ncbi:zinc-binding alcohol dehydrogenase family protein [Aspergillus tanneri]|nr:uncharacterized protein ATNIH1004_006824 [Aspergillus tanneri]KAA8645405.1 hypothetical protein ATNIH1004_006824 [Aspergillus tanneri]
MSNKSAILPTPNSQLQILDAPYPALTPDRLIVRVHAIAINPVDLVIQKQSPNIFPHLEYPITLGFDVAGEVVSVGEQISRFKTGDRVFGLAGGVLTNIRQEQGFQNYVVMREVVTAKIPEKMSYTQAVVLPLGLSTVASGMFQDDYLGMRWPVLSAGGGNENEIEIEKREETVLIWGGASSLGCNAIQLAHAAGYEVVTTASEKNFELVRSLGADHVVDYHAASAVDDLVDFLQNRKCSGALAIAPGSVEKCLDILQRSGSRPFVASASLPPAGISEDKAKFIWGGSLARNEVGPAIWERYITQAMERGVFVPMPRARVVGEGLESLQMAMDT